MRGTLILLEGLDRTGKSTQAEILAARLDAELVKFPDRSTPIGRLINTYLTDPACSLSDEAAHLLFSANRWELASRLTQTLVSGRSVVMDRYVYSGVAYSLAKAGSKGYDWLHGPDRGLPKPDLTLFLTISPELLAERKGWGDERYEKEPFQKRVKQCFLQILDPQADPTIAIVDVDHLSIEQTTARLWAVIAERGVERPTDAELAIIH